MQTRIPITLLATAGALSLAACRIDTPTGNLHSDRSGTYAAAPLPPPPGADAAYAAQPAGAPEGPVYDGYALAERAHAFDQAVYRRRPAYAFRYEREQPLVWRTADDYSMYAEPIDGGYRDYYYAPGADYPYFVRDARYGYGYGPDGRLVALYDAAGGLLTDDRYGEVAALAADYVLRARTLRRYGLDDSYRIPVSDAYWGGLSSGYYRGQGAWFAAPERRPEWRAWRRAYPRDVAVYDAAPRHDNGRHLGWYKHGGGAWRYGGAPGPGGYAVAYAQPDPGRGGGEGHGHGNGNGNGNGGEGHGNGHGHGNGGGKGHGHDR